MAKDKKFLLSGIIIHPDDTYTRLQPSIVYAISDKKAIHKTEKKYNGIMRDIQIKELMQQPKQGAAGPSE
jgi:hypothetical protein